MRAWWWPNWLWNGQSRVCACFLTHRLFPWTGVVSSWWTAWKCARSCWTTAAVWGIGWRLGCRPGDRNRGHGVISRQNRKEAGAFLSIWSVTVIAGVAVYLPLPLLGLPWIVWHHQSRRHIFQVWRRRLQELSGVAESQPGG